MKYLTKVKEFVSKTTVHAKDVASIHGTLQHVSFVYRDGRSFLPSLSRFLSSFPNKFAMRHINSSIQNDLQWWISALEVPNVSRSLSLQPSIDCDIWVDASTSWGIRLVIGNRWSAWRLQEGWNRDGRDIGWAEAIAVEITVSWITLVADFQDVEVLIRSDNTAVIDAYKKGRSINVPRNMFIRRISALLVSHNVSVSPIYVRSEENRADPISRGILGPPNLSVYTGFQPDDELKTLLIQCTA
jgi:hypothetical protein